MNRGEILALEILPKLGFTNIEKQRFVDFIATFKGKTVQVEVKYRKRMGKSEIITVKQLNEADYLLIINESSYKLINMKDINKVSVKDVRIEWC